ncbi:MAG: HD domain-containing protein [Planctomycetota bacterium]|nr:MAG: HD domain-containing protein [Planctomycetota bacterium]REK47917.1 MAG: HD domain-containing protein [Planctomycetota bacterium]
MEQDVAPRPYQDVGRASAPTVLPRSVNEVPRMNAYHKRIAKLIAAQLLCLAFGLWVSDRLLVSVAHWEVNERATAAMKQGATSTENFVPELPADWMPAILGLSFLWIGGLQGSVAYVFHAKLRDEHAEMRSRSNAEFCQRERDLLRTRDAVIFGLAKLAESRDPDTGQHLERISAYSTCLARALRRHPKFANEVTPAFVKLIGISSALHDIGKVGVEDSVLLKAGKLDADERFRMKLHAVMGGQCIQEIEERLGSSNFLSMARDIALYHHEHWNGHGYPSGLAGEKIPLAARIVAVADVYDALASKRVYKDAYPHEECLEIIREGAGTQFDPDLVQVFLSIESEIRRHSLRLKDIQEPVKKTSEPTDLEEARKHLDEVVTSLAAVADGEPETAPTA